MKKMGGGKSAMTRQMQMPKGQMPKKMMGQVKAKAGKKGGSRAKFIEDTYGDVPL